MFGSLNMKNNYSLKRLFKLLVIKVVGATIISCAFIFLLWMLWIYKFPRNYYQEVYSKAFLDSVKKEMPSILSGEKNFIENKDPRFKFLISIDEEKIIKSKNFPNDEINLNEFSNHTQRFMENNRVYHFKVFDDYSNVKILMIYPPFSTGNKTVDYISIVFQHIILASPFILFVVFLTMFTTKLYRKISSKFKVVEKHLKNIEEGDLATELPNFDDKEFSGLSMQINKMRIELKRLLDEERKKSIVQKKLFSSIAHDVRTPLTIINAESELLELASKDLTVQERCRVISSEVSIIDKLLSELLKISRLNTDTYTLEYEELNIIDILHSTILDFSPLCEKKEIKIQENYQENLISIFCDKLMITRIISNVLSNAVEHTNIDGEIKCSVNKSHLETRISISNTGSLFLDEYLQSGFVPFYSDKLQREKEHFGLGLYMSNLMIKKMNGYLSIKNENEQATVIITLKNK